MFKHRLFLFFLSCIEAFPCFSQVKQKLLNPINYNEDSVPFYHLPNPLLCNDGTVISSIREWEIKRRPEILQMFSDYVFGKVPLEKENAKWKVMEIAPQALNGRAIRKTIRVWPIATHTEYFIDVQMYLPPSAQDCRVPLFFAIALLPNYTVCKDFDVEVPDTILIGNGQRVKAFKRGYFEDFWQLDKLLSRGYGLCTFCHQDICPDTPNDFLNSIPSLFYKSNFKFPQPDEWGAISFWAWQMSRVMDYVMTDNMIDNSKIIAIGHSRFGKTALWAAAQDQRFAMAISNNSGCGGAALSRRRYGETIESIIQRYGHWFCGNFRQFSNREDYMPFDQHELIALIAPRPVYIASAKEDRWADPKGEFLSGKEASPVYHLYGMKGLECDDMPRIEEPVINGCIGYHIRSGKHTMTKYDWEQYLNFCDLNLHYNYKL